MKKDFKFEGAITKHSCKGESLMAECQLAVSAKKKKLDNLHFDIRAFKAMQVPKREERSVPE